MPSTIPAWPKSRPLCIASTVFRPMAARGTRLHPAQGGGSVDQGQLGDPQAGGDRPPDVGAGGIDHVEVRRSAEVDGDRRRPVTVQGGDRIDHPVGPHLALGCRC